MNKNKTTKLTLVIALGLVVLASVRAGDLEPPGAPGPTMVTLQQIYDLIQRQGGGALAKTGQTKCWNAAGTPIDCAATGQDGESQMGISVSPRFADNGDGTVTDELTGKVWLKNAECFGLRTWTDALTVSNILAAGSCGLTDGSVAGDWRLPNVRELQSLIDYGRNNPALPLDHPFSGVQQARYWTSTSNAVIPYAAWQVYVGYGDVDVASKPSVSGYVWPVRGRQ